ncbi:MAG: metallophosphoesterase [Clostridia bacterium]|nr:metallophosphoesterase [Clostridia bacterium]
MIYITGDTHRDFSHIHQFCKEHDTKAWKDVMIILGDAGINYFGDHRDEEFKQYLSKIPIAFFCIHGNHEMRPWHIKNTTLLEYQGDLVYTDPVCGNVCYAIDGNVYDFAGHRCLVIGGAYSVDKYYRLQSGYRWFSDEQPTKDIKQSVMEAIDCDKSIDVVLSHTCPYKYIPREMFLSGVDQSTVDDSTERFLDTVEETANYQKWYCGHWHTEKTIDRMRFMFRDIALFGG